jgi:hypothetical protein
MPLRAATPYENTEQRPWGQALHLTLSCYKFHGLFRAFRIGEGKRLDDCELKLQVRFIM